MELVGTEEHVGLNQAFWTSARTHARTHRLCFVLLFLSFLQEDTFIVLFSVCFCGFVLTKGEMKHARRGQRDPAVFFGVF